MLFLHFLIILMNLVQFSKLQSTCPVQQLQLQQQQRCKCGIKIDGHIYIYCARKQLTQLPKFTRSSILYDELILSGNQVRHIKANSFSGLRVKRLFLDDNPLESIETNSFNELANYLEELIISVNYENSDNLISSSTELVESATANKKPHLPQTLFQNLLNLKMIKLVGLEWNKNENNRMILKKNTFNRTRKLEYINLIDCGIESIEEMALLGLESSLKELNMDNNHLTQADDIFREIRKMKRIQVLNLSRNKIRSIGRFISTQNSHQLELQLDLSFNAITKIDEFGFGVSSFDIKSGLASSLIKLNLNNNELTEYQLNFLTQLINLRELNLDYNKLEHLPDNLFINMPKLESLSMKGNYLTQLSSEFIFTGLHFNMKKLNLASNKLTKIQRRVFMSTPKLRELYLEKNQLGSYFSQLEQQQQLSELKNVFEGVESELKLLNLENNFLKSQHLISLSNLLNLETLKIGHNDFSQLSLKASNQQNSTSLRSLFEFYRNLTTLDIQNSSLNQMPYFTGLNRSMQSINLAQNFLCHINPINLKYFYSKLRYLNLNANRLNCDCNSIELRKWLDELKSSNINSNESTSFQTTWKCYEPLDLRNKHLAKLSVNDLECNSNNNNDLCQLDEDYYAVKISTTTKKTTTTTTEAKIIDSILNEINNASKTTIKFTSPPQTPLPIVKTSPHILLNIDSLLSSNKNERDSSSSSSLFISSVELKQTLLGSFIGALSVILIVIVSICIVKTSSRSKFQFCGSKKTNLSNISDDHKEDKSNTTSTTSPYELGKLSLQTFCINSTSSSAASSSSSNSTTQQDIFTKMDPMRLTLNSNNNHNNNYLSFSPNLIYQHYLNNANNNNNNLHYLASNLNTSPSQSITPPPQFYELNNSDDSTKKLFENNNEKVLKLLTTANNSNSKIYITSQSQIQQNETTANTYDKLHRNNNICAATFRPISTSQLLNLKNHHQFATLALNHHNPTNSNLLTETTPFLIITDVNQLLATNNLNLNSNNMVNSNIDDSSNQHTYHEIGDVLLGYNNQNNNNRIFNTSNSSQIMSSSNIVEQKQMNQQSFGSDINSKTNAMYI